MILLQKGYVFTPSIHSRLRDYVLKCCYTLNFDLEKLHITKSLRITVAKEFERCLNAVKDFKNDLARLRRYSTTNVFITIKIIGEPNLHMHDLKSMNVSL